MRDKIILFLCTFLLVFIFIISTVNSSRYRTNISTSGKGNNIYVTNRKNVTTQTAKSTQNTKKSSKNQSANENTSETQSTVQSTLETQSSEESVSETVLESQTEQTNVYNMDKKEEDLKKQYFIIAIFCLFLATFATVALIVALILFLIFKHKNKNKIDET